MALDINQPRFAEPAGIFALDIGLTIVVDIEEHDIGSHRIERRETRIVQRLADHLESTADFQCRRAVSIGRLTAVFAESEGAEGRAWLKSIGDSRHARREWWYFLDAWRHSRAEGVV